MRGWIRLLLLPVLGTILVPSHWCCAFTVAQASCCATTAVLTPAEDKACCRRDHDRATSSQAVHANPPAERACCCQAAPPAVVSASVVTLRFDGPAFAYCETTTIDATLASLASDLRSWDSIPTPLGIDPLARLCRRNC